MKCRFEVVAVPEWKPPFVTPDRYSRTDLPNGRTLFVWVGEDDCETMDRIGDNLRSPEDIGKVFSHRVFNAFDGGFIRGMSLWKRTRQEALNKIKRLRKEPLTWCGYMLVYKHGRVLEYTEGPTITILGYSEIRKALIGGGYR